MTYQNDSLSDETEIDELLSDLHCIMDTLPVGSALWTKARDEARTWN